MKHVTKKIVASLLFTCSALFMWAQEWSPKSTEWYEPEVPVVKPGKAPGQPPSDAVILFDGSATFGSEICNR